MRYVPIEMKRFDVFDQLGHCDIAFLSNQRNSECVAPLFYDSKCGDQVEYALTADKVGKKGYCKYIRMR